MESKNKTKQQQSRLTEKEIRCVAMRDREQGRENWLERVKGTNFRLEDNKDLGAPSRLSQPSREDRPLSPEHRLESKVREVLCH